jgi:hypothetical protein
MAWSTVALDGANHGGKYCGQWLLKFDARRKVIQFIFVPWMTTNNTKGKI